MHINKNSTPASVAITFPLVLIFIMSLTTTIALLKSSDEEKVAKVSTLFSVTIFLLISLIACLCYNEYCLAKNPNELSSEDARTIFTLVILNQLKTEEKDSPVGTLV
jgi:ACR3 family arsenite efflux pump ArsB